MIPTPLFGTSIGARRKNEDGDPWRPILLFIAISTMAIRAMKMLFYANRGGGTEAAKSLLPRYETPSPQSGDMQTGRE
jgi:hypothetical protein